MDIGLGYAIIGLGIPIIGFLLICFFNARL